MAARDILSHSGKISHDEVLEKARSEYNKYQDQFQVNTLSHVERHFLKEVKEIEQISLD